MNRIDRKWTRHEERCSYEHLIQSILLILSNKFFVVFVVSLWRVNLSSVAGGNHETTETRRERGRKNFRQDGQDIQGKAVAYDPDSCRC